MRVNRRLSTAVQVSTALSTVNRLTRESGSHRTAPSTLQSPGFRTSRRIDRNLRVCARFAIIRGPGERLRPRESGEFGKTYPGAICLGPRIIAEDSPVIFTAASRQFYDCFFELVQTRCRHMAQGVRLRPRHQSPLAKLLVISDVRAL